MSDIDPARRFGGMARLYGDGAIERLALAHVVVVGIGGVGSWTVEALARSGVGRLTLVDLDHVAESNINRQLHALDSTLGKAKIVAMAERIADINPDCQVILHEAFLDHDNLDALLADPLPDVVVDAADAAGVKAGLVNWCRQRARPVVVCGAAGGKLDGTRVQVSDLARTEQDPLLAKLRGILRRHYGFPKGEGKKFKVAAVWSAEPITRPAAACVGDSGVTGLNCAGFGSAAWVTGAMGLAAAGEAIRWLMTVR